MGRGMHKMAMPREMTSALRSENSSNSTEARKRTAQAVERLSSFFPPPEIGDPRVFLAGVVDLFSRYPEQVIEKALDVSYGLPGKHKWWPRVSEIKETLDALYEPYRAATEWEAGARKQIAERNTLALSDQRKRKTYAEHQAELAERGIFIGGRTALQKPVNVEALREKFGISEEQWASIPDAK